MAFSLEARVPYLDHRLIEFVLGVPGSIKITHGETKYLQKLALKHYTIPDIVERTDKIGFGTPVEDWMFTPDWQKISGESLPVAARDFPGVLRSHARLPAKGCERWKLNQLTAWKRVCFSPRATSISARQPIAAAVGAG